jgi:hypothetical protein
MSSRNGRQRESTAAPAFPSQEREMLLIRPIEGKLDARRGSVAHRNCFLLRLTAYASEVESTTSRHVVEVPPRSLAMSITALDDPHERCSSQRSFSSVRLLPKRLALCLSGERASTASVSVAQPWLRR